MGKIFRAAIIGYGRSGRDIHSKLLSQLPDLFEAAYIVDGDAERRRMIEAETGAKALENYKDIYKQKDIDFVINSSLSNEHYPISLELLQNGYNVLSEKPAAANTAEFAKLTEAAEKNGKLYQVFQQYRFSPSYRKIKEIIASGVLGRTVQVSLNYSGFSRRWDWQTIQSFNAGSLLNTGPHPVDQGLDLMGFPEELQVTAVFDRAQTSGDAEDYAKLILQAPGAPVVDIEISSCNAYAEYTYLIQGKYGSLRGTANHLEWKYYIEADEEKRPLVTASLKGPNGEPIYCREQLTFHNGTWDAQGDEADDNNYKGLAFYRQFYKLLSDGTLMDVKNVQIMKQLFVMEEAHRQNDFKSKPFIK